MTDASAGAGNALSGVLTGKDIKAAGLISENFDKDQVEPAAYNLRVGHIITAEEYVHIDGEQGRDVRGRRTDAILLQPGQTATLATLEKVRLRLDMNGMMIPRDTYAKRGLLTLNAGHIDPGHDGFVTAQVINLTDRPYPLQLKESYFSIVFFYLSQVAVRRRRKLDPDDVRIRTLRRLAAEAPVSLIQKETLNKVFVSYDDLSFALLRRVGPFVVGLAVIVGLAVAIIRVPW